MNVEWAVGVTTVPDRVCILLPRTLESLRRGGFTSPRLFIDGAQNDDQHRHFDLPMTLRWPKIRAWGNWWLGINELYIRQPHADRYAMFQDDILCMRNLKQYLEKTPYPESGYCNLAVYPQNHEAGRKGWYRAPSGPKTNWRGLGAQGLVFDRNALLTLIGKEHEGFTHKPGDPVSGHEKIDGAVVAKLESLGIYEHVHGPSLITHIGDTSCMGHGRQPDIAGFLGEECDALALIQ